MNAALPRPAVVSEEAARRLPRLALVLFCAIYVLAGLFGRGPWKNADATAFGFMASIARGDSGWFDPRIAGLTGDGGLLPYWLGAASILGLGSGLGEPLAARLPFAGVLLGVLALTWYACYHLARTDAAQPLSLPFGGGAHPVDYSRAVADGAVLALIATLGLLQLGHETTPELVQLFAMSLLLYAVAACPYRGAWPRVAALLALPILASSGAPAVAVALGLLACVVCARSQFPAVRSLVPWLVAAMLLSASIAFALGAWTWRVESPVSDLQDAVGTARLLAWFTWPTLPLAALTLWRWRAQIDKRHISAPMVVVVVGVGACLAMGGSDRALLLALPGLAVLAAFALPTLKRGFTAAVDWFSVSFFSLAAIIVWVIYLAMQTGWPTQPASNVKRLAPGFQPHFMVWELLVGLAVTFAWLWLVRWRIGRHRHPLWKSMVLPASGVALCWSLLMSLWLPLLDHARSHHPLIERLQPWVQGGRCIWVPGAPLGLLATLEYTQREAIVGSPRPADAARCGTLLVMRSKHRPEESAPIRVPAGWERVGRAQHPSDRDNWVVVYRRSNPS